ncbi:hypothetical protein Nps_03080 [Candidatus Nanopusillus acidilobi]|nr:hypothetical protein Nps_03080 [Candidatus Nanopusillus acidilobi]
MKLLKKFIFASIIFLLVVKFIYSQGWYAVTITNNQSQATPAPFQQDIAICNGNVNIGPNFAYIDNATLFNEIDSNGQNVYFVNSSGNILYSWYEGQLNYNGVTCDVWWINIPQGIPANSGVTIYMYIGNSSSNYYSQYYPYVGASPQVISGYDNGQDVFIVYGYFDNTFDGWSGYNYYGFWSPKATPLGIEMLNNGQNEGTYILPPNNGNIPKIPLIVEEAWLYTFGGQSNAISLFGNTNQQINVSLIGNTSSDNTPASNLSTFVQFDYYSGVTYLKSAVTNQILSFIPFYEYWGTIYSYLIINSTYAQAGYYIYSPFAIVWAPLTLLDTYTVNNNGYTYSSLNYNPYQYPTLEISAGDGYLEMSHSETSYQYVEWVIARVYPPNDVMPSISIQPVSVSSTQTTSTVTTSTSTVTQTSTITTTVTTTLTSTSTITSTLTVYSTITTTTTVTSSVTATSTTTSTVYNTVTSTVTTTLTSTNTVISTVYTTLITTLTSTSTIYSTITSTQTVTSTVYTTATTTVTSTSTTTSIVSSSIYSITQTLTGSSFTQTLPSTSYIYPINQISSITIINLNSSNISTSYTYSCSSNMT